MKPHNRQAGFSLIELLTVISIIGLLASVLMVALHNAHLQAVDATNAQRIGEIQKAIELFYADNGTYPYLVNGQFINGSYGLIELAPLLSPYITLKADSCCFSYIATVPPLITTTTYRVGSVVNCLKLTNAYYLTVDLKTPPFTNKYSQQDGGPQPTRIEKIGGEYIEKDGLSTCVGL